MSDAHRPIKLLLDENLSPWVAGQLRMDGVDAVHIRERDILGAPDRDVLKLAYQEDRILVTSNIADFEKLYGATEINAGLVLVKKGDLRRVEQLGLLRNVMQLLRTMPDMVNRALEMKADGSHAFREMPKP